MGRLAVAASPFDALDSSTHQALTEEHARLDERLRQLDRLVYLTPSEQVERREIQKLKLQTKDKLFGHS